MRTVLDDIVYERRWQPFYGWHDDHRDHDRTIAYAPAVQQCREEFHDFVEMLRVRGLRGSCLQIGLGPSGAAHVLMKKVFDKAWTLEIDEAKIRNYSLRVGNPYIDGVLIGDSHDQDMTSRLCSVLGIMPGTVDCVFIDGDHTLDGVSKDFAYYASLVRPGGVIALHDAVKRPTYEDEIQVWKLVEKIRGHGHKITVMGDEIGIAYVEVTQ
jgi:hypothetical protein